jgi:hypothetical protein
VVVGPGIRYTVIGSGARSTRMEGKGMEVVDWVEMPFAGERLASVVYFGSGKDAEVRLAFADGRRVTLPAGALRVEVDRGIVVDVSRWDDVSLRIAYLGPGLRLHGGRFGYPGGGDEQADFLAAARSWLTAGCVEELLWGVDVELRLASSPPDS